MSEETIKDYMKASKEKEDAMYDMKLFKNMSRKESIFADERKDVKRILKEKGKIYPIEINGRT